MQPRNRIFKEIFVLLHNLINSKKNMKSFAPPRRRKRRGEENIYQYDTNSKIKQSIPLVNIIESSEINSDRQSGQVFMRSLSLMKASLELKVSLKPSCERSSFQSEQINQNDPQKLSNAVNESLMLGKNKSTTLLRQQTSEKKSENAELETMLEEFYALK